MRVCSIRTSALPVPSYFLRSYLFVDGLSLLILKPDQSDQAQWTLLLLPFVGAAFHFIYSACCLAGVEKPK